MNQFADHTTRLMKIRDVARNLADRSESAVAGLVGAVPVLDRVPGIPSPVPDNFLAECGETSSDIEKALNRIEEALNRLNN